MDEHYTGLRPPQEILQFLGTEQFTLQSERAAANAEVNARLQLYMSSLTSSLISLALVAQLSEIGDAFRAFAVVLLPTVYMLGLVTLGRMKQAWVDWFRASQGMGRIRHYYLEIAPEMAPYFVMPTTDDPWSTLLGSGIGRGSEQERRWWQGLYTAPAAVAIINSIVAGVFIGMLTSAVTNETGPLAAAFGGGAFLLSLAVLGIVGSRGFLRTMQGIDVRFPGGDPGPSRQGTPQRPTR